MEKIWLKNYPQGTTAEIGELEHATIPAMFESTCQQYPDSPACHNLGHTLSYSELDRLTQYFCSYLQNELQLKKGDRLGLMLPNILQHPVVMLGALRAGLIIVNINPLYTSRELTAQLLDSDTRTLVVLENMAHTIQAAQSNLELKNIIITSIGDLLPFPRNLIVNTVVRYIKRGVPKYKINRIIRFTDTLKIGSQQSCKAININTHDTAYLQYTGGTTGQSKGAVLSHHNVLSNIDQFYYYHANSLSFNHGKEIMLTPLPLYHIYALTCGGLLSIKMAALNILITNPRDISGLIKEIKKWRISVISGVNTLYKNLVANADFKNADFSNLKLCTAGGMPLEKNVDARFFEATGKHLIEGYGLSETSPVLTSNPPNPQSFSGSIGLPIPSTEISIRDENEQELPQGETGELCAKGPQVMSGYWNNAEATAATFTKDGFFKTGDIAIMDEKGFIRIVDRKKDMILVSGFNVFPNEVEQVIAGHPAVEEVACIGVPDEETMEGVKAFVVKKPGKALDAQTLRDHVKPLLAAYKRPKYIEFIDALPKSNVGKILRRELRQLN